MFRCAIVLALAVPPIGIGMGVRAETGDQGRAGAWSVSKAAAQCVIEQAVELPDGSQYRLRGELRPPSDESQLVIDVAANTRAGARLNVVWGEHRTSDLVAEKHVDNLYRYRISLPASAMLQPAVGHIAVRARDKDLLAAAIDYSATNSAAANACWSGLLASWNIDARAASAVATAASATTDQWLTADDYPTEALALHQQGRVTVIWTVRPDLSTGDCKVIESSGHASLDNTTCELALRRIRYVRPALDGAGKPVVSWDRRTLNWIQP